MSNGWCWQIIGILLLYPPSATHVFYKPTPDYCTYALCVYNYVFLTSNQIYLLGIFWVLYPRISGFKYFILYKEWKSSYEPLNLCDVEGISFFFFFGSCFCRIKLLAKQRANIYIALHTYMHTEIYKRVFIYQK